MEHVGCCLCGEADGEPLGVGEDFEYRTSPDTFLTLRCRACDLVYLSPRPQARELSRIYPDDYHAFNFSVEQYGFVYKVRRWLEARRLLACCRDLGEGARILDIGCGDGFHLNLLKDFGPKSWWLEGVDPSDSAIEAAIRNGLQVHHGKVQDLALPRGTYDLALMIATVEHVENPAELVSTVRNLLKPGGRLLIVTDNTDTVDFRLSQARHWGGYHFPRHWYLFSPAAIRILADRTTMEVESLSTIVSPVNWVYSIRNRLVDWGAPRWLVERFSLGSTVSLGVFTLFDMIHQLVGKGALIRAVLRRPA